MQTPTASTSFGNSGATVHSSSPADPASSPGHTKQATPTSPATGGWRQPPCPRACLAANVSALCRRLRCLCRGWAAEARQLAHSGPAAGRGVCVLLAPVVPLVPCTHSLGSPSRPIPQGMERCEGLLGGQQ
eukprot:13103037-Alexandrium_andersonii.AAC.1